MLQWCSKAADDHSRAYLFDVRVRYRRSVTFRFVSVTNLLWWCVQREGSAGLRDAVQLGGSAFTKDVYRLRPACVNTITYELQDGVVIRRPFQYNLVCASFAKLVTIGVNFVVSASRMEGLVMNIQRARHRSRTYR